LLTQLIPALQKMGTHITISASGDSQTTARLLPPISRNLVDLMNKGSAFEYAYYEQRQLQLALEQSAGFDVIHSHIGPGAYLFSDVASLHNRVLHTVHWPVHADLEWFIRQCPNLWFSTVSEFQAHKLRNQGATRCHIVENGIDVSEFTFCREGGKGLVFIGRMERVKGPDIAVQAGRSLGYPLILAGPIMEQEFFDRSVAPFLDRNIRYIGTVDHPKKNQLLGQAGCAVLPFRREEPFGLVAIEAMACGTPVVALANGAMPEIVEPGVTGYLARDETEIPDLLPQALKLDRAAIRHRVSERFAISIVAEKYCLLYSKIAASGGQFAKG
jgi:glycosyltransferase involved in cell wall biosynthesis